MADLYKENIRRTSGAGGGGSGDGSILDGAVTTIKATVINNVATAQGASDNPLLVTMGPHLDFDTGGGTDLYGLVGIALPASGGAVIGGTDTNPIVTRAKYGPSSVQRDGVKTTLAAATSQTFGANADRQYLEVLNKTGAVVYLALDRTPATTNDFEIPANDSWFMEAPAIYTGAFDLLSVAGGTVYLIEF